MEGTGRDRESARKIFEKGAGSESEREKERRQN
jgi:hypothetical protein